MPPLGARGVPHQRPPTHRAPMQVRPRDGPSLVHQRHERAGRLKSSRDTDEGAGMNTTRYRTVRALTGAIVAIIRIAPTKALAAHSLPLEDFSPLRTLDEKAHLYAATYIDHSEGEPHGQ